MWNEQQARNEKGEKNHNNTQKNIEHGGEIPYHALCCVLEVLEDYRIGHGQSRKIGYAVCMEKENVQCPHCLSDSLYRHGYYRRMIRAKGRDGARKRLRLKIIRYKCRCCGKSFAQDCGHIGLQKWQRRNARLNNSISLECMHGVSNKVIAQKYGVSPSTGGRQLHRNHEKLLGGQIHYPCPIVMGIDEHSIHRRSTKGHKFAVTLTDLRNNRVYEVFEGKDCKTLEPQLRRLKGRGRVKVVCMDLSGSFRSMVTRLFPHAKIVADRFHVIKLVIETFLEFCRNVDPGIRWKRGLTRCLRKNRGNLTGRQESALQSWLAANPLVETAYNFKEELCNLLRKKGRNRASCVPLVAKPRKRCGNCCMKHRKFSKSLGVRYDYGLSRSYVCGASRKTMGLQRASTEK